MIKPFTTSKGEFLAVLLPDDFDELGDIEKFNTGETFISYYNDYEMESIWLDLPTGNYSIIGLQCEITEEQAKEIVYKDNEFRWVDYKDLLIFHDNALAAFNSLMQSIECYTVNNDGTEPDNRLEWKKTQANTGNWLILRKEK